MKAISNNAAVEQSVDSLIISQKFQSIHTIKNQHVIEYFKADL